MKPMKSPQSRRGMKKPSSGAVGAHRPAKGPSIKSLIDRQMYFAITGQTQGAELNQLRQERALELLHSDISPNWYGDSTPIAQANLKSPAPGGQTNGVALTSDGVQPPEAYIAPPQ